MENEVNLLKALSDTNRLLIIKELSKTENCNCGANCGCGLLENLDISQSTLSHHMKILCDCGITIPNKGGKKTFYSLNRALVNELIIFLKEITATGDKCVCGCHNN